MELEPYQGWSNYPTWAVNLWLGNDEHLYLRAQEMKADAKERAEWGHHAATTILADQLCRLVTAAVPDLENGPYKDLLTWALSVVDWAEIATKELDA